MQSINNTKTLTIVREHDKLCILEKLLNNNTELEKLVSIFIEHRVNHDHINKFKSFNHIKDYLKNFNLLSKIINLSCSIADETPYEILIPINDNNDNNDNNNNNNNNDNIIAYLHP